MGKNIISLMSGGLDSFLATYFLTKENYNIIPLHVSYQQLAQQYELKAVRKQLTHLNITNDLQHITINGISNQLTNSLTTLNKPNDFYPGRNLQLLLIAAQLATVYDADEIAIGINRSVRVYPDTQTKYLKKVEKILKKSTGHKISIKTPVAQFSKREEVQIIKDHGLPIDIIYSCLQGKDPMCEACSSCDELFDAIKYVYEL